MSKIIAIDFGKKRSGIAETDDLQMMAFGLTAVDTINLRPFLRKYFLENEVEKLVIGLSLDLKGNLNEIESDIDIFIAKFSKEFPKMIIERQDERFSSKIASRAILEMGKKKKQRQDRYLVDEVSATIILQSYLEKKN